MKEITLQFQSGEDLVLNLPENWNECNTRQAASALAIMQQGKFGKFTTEELTILQRKMLLLALAEDEDGNSQPQFPAYLESLETYLCEQHGEESGEAIFLTHLKELSDCLKGFYVEEQQEDDSIQLQIARDFTRLPFHSIPIQRTLLPKSKPKRNRKGKVKPLVLDLYAPSDGLAGSSFLEIQAIGIYLRQYLDAPSDDTLHQLLATAFRPAKQGYDHSTEIDPVYRGRIRVDYNGYEGNIKSRAAAMTMLAPAYKQVAVFWLSCCLSQLQSRYAQHYSDDTETGGDLMKLFALLADSPEKSKWDDVANNSYANVMAHLDLLQDRAKAHEKALKEAKKQ